MWKLSQDCNPLMGKTFNSGPPTMKMSKGLISGLQVSGVEPGVLCRMFCYPSASSYRNKELVTLYRTHKAAKKQEYGERVREVKRGVFTPLVFSSTGRMACECTTFFKRLADLLSVKKQLPYSQVLCWFRCRLSFALLRSAIMAVRGPMTFSLHAQKQPCAIM